MKEFKDAWDHGIRISNFPCLPLSDNYFVQKRFCEPDGVVHPCNPSTLEAENRKFKASLSHIQKKKEKKKCVLRPEVTH
jgi:hypothetical protein